MRITTLVTISRQSSAAPEANVRRLTYGGYRQLGSQISMVHVDCEIGIPVSTG